MTARSHPKAQRSDFTAVQEAYRPVDERGVVLIIALILLVILSLVTAYSVRGAGSSEMVTGNTRTQLLAMQATEAALRYCETSVINHHTNVTTPGSTLSPAIAPKNAPISGADFDWMSLANWDGDTSATSVTVISVGDLVLNDSDSGLYKRSPECMAQYIDVTGTARVVITARGFGPDVIKLSGSARPAPDGSEVWLQSTVVIPTP